MGLLRSVFSPSPSPSSSRRRSQLNPASVQGTEGKFLCFRGCFGGGCHAEAPREIASRENKAVQNKSLAIIRRLLKRKSKSGSTNLLLVHENGNVHEARVPAASDQDTAASIGSVDTSIDALEFLTLAKSRDMDTDKNSPPSSSSTESRTIIARADREGIQECIVSPVLLSFRFNIPGYDGASTPETLLFHDELDCISLADTCGTITCNGNEGSCESMISPILNSSSLTSGSDAGFWTPDVLSGISTLEEGTCYPLDSGSSAETRSSFTSSDDEVNCKLIGSDAGFRTPDVLSGIGTLEEGTGYPLDTGSSAETRSSCTSSDDEVNCKLIGSDAGFRTPDILSRISTLEEGTGYPSGSGSSAETRSSFTSSEDELNCKLIGSDDGFRTPDILSGISTLEEGTGYPLDSGSLAETQSAFTSTDDELNCKMMFQVALEMLMEMESLLPTDGYDREVEGEFGVSDCVSSSVSRSPFVCWSNRRSRNTVQPSSGSPIFAQPDVLFPPSPRPVSLPSNSSITSSDKAEDHEMMVVSEMLMEMENLVPSDTYDSEAERDFEVRDRVRGSISSSPLVCWSNRQGRMTVEPSFGCALFEHPDTLFPPSPCAPCSTPCSSVSNNDEALDHEITVTLETLMAMENMLPEDTYDGEEERDFGIRDCIYRSVSRSPFICWSDRQCRMTVEPSSGSTLFAPLDALFPLSPQPPSSPSCSSVSNNDEALDHELTVTLETLMAMENMLPEDTYDVEEGREFGIGDCVSRSVSRSPLICWSDRHCQMTVEPSSGSTLFAPSDILFPLSPRPPSSPSCSSVSNNDEALDHEFTVTLETLMAMENMLPEDTYDGEEERDFGIGDCVSRSVSRSPFICWSDRHCRMTVEPSSGSTLFAPSDALLPLSPRPPSSPSCSSLSNSDKALDHEIAVTLETLMAMENMLPEGTYDGEEERDFGIGDCVSRSVSHSPFICWSDRQCWMTVEPSSGSTLFAPSDALFPLSPRHLSSTSPNSPPSVCIGKNCSKDGGAENTWIAPFSGRVDADRNHWTDTSTNESGNWEPRVTVEMLMKLENLLESSDGKQVDMEFGLRDSLGTGQLLPVGLLVSTSWVG